MRRAMGKKRRGRGALVVAFVSGTMLWPAISGEQTYPSRPITLIVPSAPGGAVDLANRLVSEKVAGKLGQPLVLDFRPGGGATIGATAIARARPDGYTIGFLGSGVVAAQGLGKPLTFDVREFVPLGQFLNLRVALLVSPSVPAKTVAELVALAKAQPGALNFASNGYGSAPHIAAELFMQAAGVKFQHVPYQGGAVAMQDLIAGRVQVFFEVTATSVGLHKDGKVRALAVTGTERAPSLPDVPTFTEIGYGKAEYYSWGGWVMPRDTPAEVAQKVSDALADAGRDQTIRKRYDEVGSELLDVPPQEFGAFIRSELAKYEALAKSAGLKLE
jgi:tripartite-type tricarboxylate transporter receptor subunit TctC